MNFWIKNADSNKYRWSFIRFLLYFPHYYYKIIFLLIINNGFKIITETFTNYLQEFKVLQGFLGRREIPNEPKNRPITFIILIKQIKIDILHRLHDCSKVGNQIHFENHLSHFLVFRAKVAKNPNGLILLNLVFRSYHDFGSLQYLFFNLFLFFLLIRGNFLN